MGELIKEQIAAKNLEEKVEIERPDDSEDKETRPAFKHFPRRIRDYKFIFEIPEDIYSAIAREKLIKVYTTGRWYPVVRDK